MATFTVRPEGIIRQPALTMPGNATGAEAACTSLTASQIRTLLSLGTADSPSFSGMTLSGHLLFNATNTYDVGNGTYDPRTVRAATSVLTPLVNNASAALTLGNSTYGVTVPGFLAVGGARQSATFEVIGNDSGGVFQRIFNADSDNLQYATFGLGGSVAYGISSWVQSALLESTTSGGISFSAFQTSAPIKFTFGSGRTEKARFSPTNGHLLIGTTTDDGTSKLQVAGAATFSGDISMSKTSAQGYLTAYSPSLLKYVSTSMTNGGAGVIQANGDSLLLQSNTAAITLGSDLLLQTPANGSAYVFRSGVNSTFDVYNSGSPSYKYTRLTHDGTSGILSTSAGNLNLIPTGGTVAVTGGITASGNVSYAQGLSTGTVTKSANYTTTADDYRVNVTTNSIDITFETAVGCANREHEVINSGSGVVTLKTTSAQTISGSASGALTLAQWKSIRVVSDGANWLIMSQIT